MTGEAFPGMRDLTFAWVGSNASEMKEFKGRDIVISKELFLLVNELSKEIW